MTSDAPNGVFITFEGGEGAGKSTQIARLAEALREQGRRGQDRRAQDPREVITTREPGGTPRAEAIREALLRGVAKPHGPLAEALLFSAARIDHLDGLIRPALARGAIVLCDRFSDSTRAYQGAASGTDAAVLRALERVTLDGTWPDLTFILDLPPEIGLSRARARAGVEAGAADRFEAEALDFHVRLRAAFGQIARDEPQRCVVIDAGLDADAVAAAIRVRLVDRWPELLSSDEQAGDRAKARVDAA